LNTNIIKNIFLALGAVFALLLLIVGIGGWLVTGPAPTEECGTTQIKVSPEAAASLDDKIAAFERQIDEAAEGEVLILEITEEEATSKVAQLAKEGRISLEMNYIQIHFIDNSMCGSALVDLLIDMQVVIQATIRVEDGKPDITIEGLHLGRIPIPKTLIDNVMTALEKEVEDRWEALPIEFEQINIENGEMIIIGRVKQTS
jgi:hypothetical protein